MTLSMVLQDDFTRFQHNAPTVPTPALSASLLAAAAHAPPSHGSPTSSSAIPPPSSTAPSSVGHSRPPSPCCVALKSSQKGSKQPSTAALKGRCQREPSPVQAKKRERSVNCSEAGKSRPPSPRPTFLGMVHSGVATDVPTTPHAPSAKTAPQKAPRPRPVCNKSAPKAMDVGRHARLDGNNASTQPQCKANALAPAAGTTDGAEDEGSDDGDNGLCLEDLT
ncbi:hypothetical protein V8E53_005522 [Lactarius tabidus]